MALDRIKSLMQSLEIGKEERLQEHIKSVIKRRNKENSLFESPEAVEERLREKSQQCCYYHQLTIHEKINAKANRQIGHPAQGTSIYCDRSKSQHGWNCEKIDWELIIWQRKNHHEPDPDRKLKLF